MVHPIFAEHTQVISLQNGLGNLEAIAQMVNPEKIIGGVTSHGATLIDTGHIRHAGKGDTIIGRTNKQIDDELQKIANLLSGAGIETKVSSDVESTIWSKLIVNAAINPLTAITRLKNGQLLESDETRRLLDLVAEESEKIVKIAGISLAYPDIKSKVYDVCEATAQNTSSMLQDILRGRRTEIDAINGAIVEKAKELNINAPVNEMLTCLVKMLQK
jgi:2-dehydropantoate 2-reductase